MGLFSFIPNTHLASDLPAQAKSGECVHFCSVLQTSGMRPWLRRLIYNCLEEGLMPQVPIAGDASMVQARAMPSMTWNGTLVGLTDTETHYLHLSVFPCEKCNGPVIAGSMGTRHDDISQEMDIKPVGAACIGCGFRPEVAIERAVDHRFRPVEWKWMIKGATQPTDLSGASRPADASKNVKP